MMKATLPLAILLACGSFAAAAQDLSTEITVDRTVVTELPAASPLSTVSPRIPALPGSGFTLQPSQYTRASDFSAETAVTDAAPVSGIEAPDTRRGYVWAGYFPVYNLAAAAGYRFIDSRSTQLGASAAFDGMSYNNANTFGPSRVNSNSLSLQADFSHHISKSLTVMTKALYLHSGLKSPSVADNSLQSQSIDAADISAGISGGSAIRYTAGLRFNTFNLGKDILLRPAADNIAGIMAPGADDSRIRFGGSVSLPLSAPASHIFHVAAEADILRARGLVYSDPYSPEAPAHATTGIVSIDPSLSFTFRRAQIRIGARLDIGINSPDRTFHAAPDIDIRWSPSGRFTAFASLGGGEEFRTLSWQYQYSNFAPGSAASTRSYTPVDGRAGIHVRPFGSLGISLYGGYAAVRRLAMPATVTYFKSPLPYTAFVFVPVDLSGWNCGIDIDYSFRRLLAVRASAKVYPHNYASGNAAAPDRAKVTFDLTASIRPTKAVTVDLSYRLRACRRYYAFDMYGVRTARTMHNISDLDIEATYAVTDALSIFARLENILNRHALIQPAVEQQPIHGLVGAQLKF